MPNTKQAFSAAHLNDPRLEKLDSCACILHQLRYAAECTYGFEPEVPDGWL